MLTSYKCVDSRGKVIASWNQEQSNLLVSPKGESILDRLVVTCFLNLWALRHLGQWWRLNKFNLIDGASPVLRPFPLSSSCNDNTGATFKSQRFMFHMNAIPCDSECLWRGSSSGIIWSDSCMICRTGLFGAPRWGCAYCVAVKHLDVSVGMSPSMVAVAMYRES